MKSRNSTVDNFVKGLYLDGADDYISYRDSVSTVHPESIFSSLVEQLLQNMHGAVEILDLGCGYGGSLPNNGIQFSSYAGVDLSKKLLHNHKYKKLPAITLYNDDITTWIPPPNLRYNFLIAILSLNYVNNLQKVLETFKKTNTWFCIGMPNPDYDMASDAIKEHNLIELEFNGRKFCYYHHKLIDLIDALQPFHFLKLSYPQFFIKQDHSPYYLAYGQWR